MTIRLNKVTRDLNVGITTAVEFLQKKGFTVEANPNTKITDEQFEMLKKEFSTDKDLKIKSERISQERQNFKERTKATAARAYENAAHDKERTEEIKTVVPEDRLPKFKPVGKIDLDSLNHPKPTPAVQAEKTEEPAPQVVEEPEMPVPSEPEPVVEPEPQPEPVAEPVEPQPVAQPEEMPDEPVETPEPVEPEPVVEAEMLSDADDQPEEEAAEEPAPQSREEEIFKIHHEGLGTKINIIGQIDLAALNQSTRPRKKSKEEKRREREEKEKQRQDQRKQMK